MKADKALKGEENRLDSLIDRVIGKHPTKGHQLLEFFLQNNKTFKTSYFTSLFYYEPYVTDLYVNESTEDLDIVECHIFHTFFPKRKVFFYPKMIILQSSKPYFSFHKSFLEFYYRVVLKPYLVCSKPLSLKYIGYKPYNHKRDQSVVKHKEFFLSFLFASKINLNFPIIRNLTFVDYQFKLETLYYDKHYIEKSNYALLTDLFENKENIRKFVLLYFYLLLERKIVIVHKKPSELMQLLFNILKPL